jgi:hypothetical protein
MFRRGMGCGGDGPDRTGSDGGPYGEGNETWSSIKAEIFFISAEQLLTFQGRLCSIELGVSQANSYP